MDKRWSDKNREKLVNAALAKANAEAKAKAEEARQKAEAKEEEKYWAEIEAPISLADGLSRLTKNELSEIRSNFGIKGVSTLKKQELADVLVQQIPGALPAFLNKFDKRRYRLFKQVADRDGQAFVPLKPNQLDYFRQRSLLFSGTYDGRRTLVMPQEVLEVFKHLDNPSYQETIRRNTEWIQLAQGMLYYYGTLGVSELKNLMHQYIGANLPMLDYLDVLTDSAPFYEEIKYGIRGFSNIRVFDPDQVKQEHQARPDLPYYPFTKVQLLRAGEPGFSDRNASYTAFVNFLYRAYSITRDVADSAVQECVYAIQNGETPPRILEILQSQFEIEDLELVEIFMGHIVALHNNTRQWSIKGHTPDELHPPRISQRDPLAVGTKVFHFATGKKVGRNDPCPCGSGKKFKKCCGR